MTELPRSDVPAFGAQDLEAIRHWAHDVRAELAGLTDHLRLIVQDRLDSCDRAQIASALRRAEAMDRMIQSAAAQLSGEVRAPLPTDLDHLLRDLELIFTRSAATIGTELTFNRDPALPRNLALDRVLVDRILRNLIGNALRHARPRQIEVMLEQPAPGRLRLKVRDDGPGFVSGTIGGSGLGLGIVATQAAMAGGGWGLGRSAVGGAEVWVDLPAPAAPVPEEEVRATPVPGGLLAQRRILVVDDTESTLRVLSSLLGGEGADVTTARNGADALDQIAARPWDILVVDATMPGMPGAQLIRKLRARPDGLAGIPALAMTADSSAHRHDELIAAGASRVVTKPLPEPAELLRIVDRLLTARAVGPAPRTADFQDEVPLFDPEPLRRVLAPGGPEVAREILDRLGLDLTETLARLDQAGNPPDPGNLRATTHVLIALAGTCGAMRLLQQVQALNQRLQAGQVNDLAPLIAEVRLLTAGAIVALARMPLPTAPRGESP